MIPDQPIYREYHKKSPGIEFNRVKSQNPGQSATGPAKPSPTSLKDRRNYFFESFHNRYRKDILRNKTIISDQKQNNAS